MFAQIKVRIKIEITRVIRPISSKFKCDILIIRDMPLWIINWSNTVDRVKGPVKEFILCQISPTGVVGLIDNVKTNKDDIFETLISLL